MPTTTITPVNSNITYIHERYQEEFGKYGIELKMRSFCVHCGYDEIIDIDLVNQFFRMVYSG